MIRATCPHCQFAQEFPDTQAGVDVPCGWCGEPLNVGGPTAEYVPDDAPERESLTAGRVVGSLFVAAAALLGLLALVGLPILDFGYGVRIGNGRPTEAFWPVLVAAYGFQWVGETLRGERQTDTDEKRA